MGELERYKAAYVAAMGHLAALPLARYDIIAEEMRVIFNPPPETETVEVERWMCTLCDELHDFSHVMERCGAKLNERGDVCASTGYVKLTGTFQRPKPVKVERSVSITFDTEGKVTHRTSIGHGSFDLRDSYGKSGTFTWQE